MIRLKQLREELGINQTTFSKQLGFGQSTVSNWENGNRILDVNTATMLANFFGVSVDYLLGNSDIREKTPSKQQASLDNIDEERLDEELIDALCKLNDEELNQVTSFVQFLLSSPRE